MNSMMAQIKSWNGKMPLTVSFGMVWFFSLLGMYFLDIFDVYPRSYFSHLLMFACYCFIQHFFLVFLRRFLLLKTIPSLYRVIRFYFITYLLITGLGILFDLSNGDYEHLLYLSSWFIIACFYKKNIVKNIHFLKENISNPRFWITLIVASLFIVGAGILIAWCGFATFFSAAMAVPFNIMDIIAITFGASGTVLLIFYSLIMLRYIIRRLYFGKFFEGEWTAFKKFIKTLLMTVLMYLVWLSIFLMIFAFQLDVFFGTSGIFAAFITVFALLTYMIKKIRNKKLSDIDWRGLKKVLQIIGITIFVYLLFIPFVIIMDTFLGDEDIGIFIFSIYNFAISGCLGYYLIPRLSDEGKNSLKETMKMSLLHIGIASVVGWILLFSPIW